jgi:S-adenosylmethionine:diacylglycerol 3-amino-3-carboxypropyl transferase
MTVLDDLRRDYRVAFLRHLARREEAALARGYELGRSVLTQGVGLLELAQVHHEVFAETLRDSRAEDVDEVIAAASQFFMEVLATSDMAQRSFLDSRRGLPPDAPGPRPGNGTRAARPGPGGATGRAPGNGRGRA